MHSSIPLFVLGSLCAAPINPGADPAEKDRALLAGTWVTESATCCAEPLPVLFKGQKEGQPVTWTFEGTSFKAFVGGPKDAVEVGTIRVEPGQSPKHLDLIPPKESELGPRKCLYAIKGDELTIAMSLWFAPGSAEDEATEGKKMRATRPAGLVAKRDDLALILVLKRQKK